MSEQLPFETSHFDRLPISTVICAPVFKKNHLLVDYSIVYANSMFADDWEFYRPGEPIIGSSIMKSGMINKELINLMTVNSKYQTPFSFYIQEVDIYVHFQPMRDLPEPYVGYFMTNVSEYEKKSSKIHFLRSLKQIDSAAILMKYNANDNLEAFFVSEEFVKMMEYKNVEDAQEHINGAGFIATIYPEDQIAVKKMLKNHRAENNSKNLTIRNITKSGKIIWCSIYFAFIDDFGENLIYCTYFDVTTLRVYAQRLQTSYMSIVETFYRETEDTLGIFRVNLSKDVIEEIKGRDLFGTDSTIRSYSAVMAMRSKNYPIANERQRFLKIFDIKKLISNYLEGKVQISEYFFSRRKDGRFCYVKFTAMLTRHPVSNEFIAFFSEIEANKNKVNQTLIDKILARQFDMVSYIVNGKYGVVLGDSSLIEKGSIFPTSRNGDYSDYINNQVLPTINIDEREKIAKALNLKSIEKNAKPDKPYIVNIACLIDGEIYYKRLDIYSVNPEAKFFILLKSDTTEIQRKQLEQNYQLKAALKEAKQANVAKTAFLSRMSHEIRTPMNAIIGLDNIALHEPDLSEAMKSHLNQIGQSASYLLSLINDILDMSRIESGRMTLKNEEFSFESFLDQIKVIVDGQCRDKNLNFHCCVIGNIEPFYIGDDTKLKQVLINILGNSVKFTEIGGDITLEVECTAHYEGQSNFRFTMKDTGIGMDKEYLPIIFEAFSQEDSSTTSRYGGSGLGLAITKNIVEMMNGSITVDSEKGVGTTFIINVPLKNSARKLEDVYEVNLHLLNVLVIDDDIVSREHAKSVLAEAGVDCETCSSGKKALDMIKLHNARHEQYNLILIDYHMPDQDGFEVTRQVRDLIGDTATIIMITGFDTFELEDQALKSGADAIMEKPLTTSSLIYEIEQIYRRKKIQASEIKLADLNGRRILVAEDMMVNAQIMMMLLSMKNMQAEHALNGKLALEMFEKSEPGYYDAVLMDVRMPEMDGLEAAAAIRKSKHPDAKKIPIIAMTANAFDEDVQRSLQAGMNAHLSKPVEPEHMYHTLQELIAKAELN